MEKEATTSAPTTNFCNITTTFSGIGNTLLDVNSIVTDAVLTYNLDLKEAPYQTIYLHFNYIVQNLRKYQLKDIIFMYEFTGDLHFDLAIQTLNRSSTSDNTQLFRQYENMEELLENTRIALALVNSTRSQLRDFLLSLGLYVGHLDVLMFEVPFIFTVVSSPKKTTECKYSIGKMYKPMKENMSEQNGFSQDVGLSSLDKDKMNGEFFDFNKEWTYNKINPVNEKLLMEIFENNLNPDNQKIYFDGRIHSEARTVHVEDCKPTENLVSAGILKEDESLKISWSGKDLDLLMPPIPEKTPAKHLANIARSAMSLYDGKFHFSSISKASERPKKLTGKMLKIVQENEERLRKEKEKQDNAWLKSFYADYIKLLSVKEKREKLENTVIRSDYINRRLLLLKIELYSDVWSLEKRNEEVDERVLVPLYLHCLKYIEDYGYLLLTGELEFVIGKLIEGRFEATAMEIVQKLGVKLDVKFSEGTTAAPNDLDLYFQLKYAGDHLKRTLGTRKDRRVPFDPDKWQVELIDAVDAGKSAIVAAPTSSGKTFICFYAIEKVLKSSDTDMVVFCLPTKALVNQVSADIYARFSPKNVKVALQGTLMADHCNEPFNCQVLITVPAMLESLLNSRDCSAIKHIIIDEAHKINDPELGLRIERVIHMARCPLLLLSATLGNLDGFYGWFSEIERAKGRGCALVCHGERYCELKPYVFSLSDTDENKKGKLVPLNGMFPYSFSHLRDFGFGNDIHFLPEELLDIYLYIYTILDQPQKKLIKHLAPKKFFKSNIICKADVREYQNHLLGTFREWVSVGILKEEQVKEIHGLLTSEAHQAFKGEDTDTNYIVDNIMNLLDTLKEEDALPVIVFNTDRDFVTELAKHVYERLEARDVKKKKDKQLELLKKEAKRTRDVEKTKMSWIEDSIAAEQMIEPETRDIRYTYLDRTTKLSDHDVREELHEVKRVPKIIVEMVYRGIGIHHAAMSRKYRSAIEILFRKKHVRVLFATETLALGINMPCRTVVFAGDSLQLDPMNYKQMSGRAGRRGFDILGNVVFFGVSKNRVQNLMVSMLPEIRGGYAYSNTSLVSFNIEDSLVKRPLASSSSKIISLCRDMKEIKLSNDAVTTLDVLDSFESRVKLVAFQKSIYPHIYPSNYLWDLYISNRSHDPSIFIFGLLFHSNVIIWTPTEFMNLVGHLFEVRLVLPEAECTLPPLPAVLEDAFQRINNIYLQNVSSFFTPALKTLQRQSTKPLFYLKSFLYSSPLRKNSYILDFYTHGSVPKIRKKNAISPGDLWQSLHTISTFLKSLLVLIETYFGSSDDRLKKLRIIHAEFDKKFQQTFA